MSLSVQSYFCFAPPLSVRARRRWVRWVHCQSACRNMYEPLSSRFLGTTCELSQGRVFMRRIAYDLLEFKDFDRLALTNEISISMTPRLRVITIKKLCVFEWRLQRWCFVWLDRRLSAVFPSCVQIGRLENSADICGEIIRIRKCMTFRWQAFQVDLTFYLESLRTFK